MNDFDRLAIEMLKNIGYNEKTAKKVLTANW